MKILQYLAAIDLLKPAGGAKRSFCEMANALTARGHEVYAVCDSLSSGRPFYPLDERVHFINLNSFMRPKHKPLKWKFTRPFRFVAKGTWDRYIGEPFNEQWKNRKGESLLKLISDIQPDIVIPYFIEDYFSMCWQRPLNLPVILTHREDAKSFRGETCLSNPNCRRVDTPEKVAMINTCPHLHVMQSSFVPEIAEIYHGSIHVIPNTVPQVNAKDLADLTTEKKQKKIMMVSRIHPTKQQHILVQAFGKIANDYPDWKIEIYGPETEGKYYQQIQEVITSLGLMEQVEFMGATDNPIGVLRNADISAFPSIHPEGWGRTLTEGMTVGLPSVGLKTTSSVNELIVDGVNGFLSDNTPEDFAAKLKLLMDNQDMRVKMGKAAHEMMKSYAPDKVYDQWENLIVQVVQQHQQRQATKPKGLAKLWREVKRPFGKRQRTTKNEITAIQTDISQVDMIPQNTIEICLAADNGYAPHAAALIASCMANKLPGDKLFFHFFADNTASSVNAALRRMSHEMGFGLTLYEMSDEQFMHLPRCFHKTRTPYFRLAMHRMLPASLKKVLYLDCDMIVMSSLQELYSTDISNCYAAVVAISTKVPHMLTEHPYFNSGMLLLNLDKYRSENMEEQAMRFGCKHGKRQRFADQDRLNYIFKGNVIYVPLTWNMMLDKTYRQERDARGHVTYPYSDKEFYEAETNPKIIHYVNRTRPWCYGHKHPNKALYWKYLKKTPFYKQVCKEYYRSLYAYYEKLLTKYVQPLKTAVKLPERFFRHTIVKPLKACFVKRQNIVENEIITDTNVSDTVPFEQNTDEQSRRSVA